MKKMIVFLLMIMCLFTLSAQNWTTVGGNNQRNGITSSAGSTDLDILWEYQYDEPAIMSYNCFIWEEKSVTTHFQVDMSTGDMNSKLICINVLSGTLLWELEEPDDLLFALGFNENHVYAISWDNESVIGDFYSIDASTGSIEWILENTCQTGAMDWWYPVFTDEGNIIANQYYPSAVICIDKNDGSIIWSNEAWSFPVTGGTEQFCISGDKIYGLQADFFMYDLYVAAYDVNDGDLLYTSESLDPESDQQIPISVSNDGKVFVMLQDGGVIALQDTGTEFVNLWEYPSIGGFSNNIVPLFNFGLSQDQSALYVTDGYKMLKISTESGDLIAESPDGVIGRLVTVDINDNLFISELWYDVSHYWCLNSDLEIIWTIDSPMNADSGISIGSDNIMLVPMTDRIVAYQSSNNAVTQNECPLVSQANNFPNPFNPSTTISYNLSTASNVEITIYNSKGQLVDNLLNDYQSKGCHNIIWDAGNTNTKLSSGLYFYQIKTDNEKVSKKMILMK